MKLKTKKILAKEILLLFGSGILFGLISLTILVWNWHYEQRIENITEEINNNKHIADTLFLFIEKRNIADSLFWFGVSYKHNNPGFTRLLKSISKKEEKPISERQIKEINIKYKDNYGLFLDRFAESIGKTMSKSQKTRILAKYNLLPEQKNETKELTSKNGFTQLLKDIAAKENGYSGAS